MKKITKEKQLKELSQQLGIDLKPIQGKATLGSTKHRIRLLQFARDWNLIITPVGWQYYIDSFAKFGVCPCDSTRKQCPCPEAVHETHEQGHCLCKLFWRSYATYQVQQEKS